MARDYKRLSRRARHLIRRLRRTRHASVQNVMTHEISNEIHRSRYGRPASTASPDLGPAGRLRPLSRRARQLLTQLRRAKVWAVQRRIVKELAAEMERGRRSLGARIARMRPARLRRRRRSGWSAASPAWRPARPEPETRPAREAPGRSVPARETGRPEPARIRPASAPRPARTRS